MDILILNICFSGIKMSGCCFIRFESDNSETNKFTPTIVVTDRIFSNFDGREFFTGQSGSELEKFQLGFRTSKLDSGRKVYFSFKLRRFFVICISRPVSNLELFQVQVP